MTAYGQITSKMLDANYAYRHNLPMEKPTQQTIDLRNKLIDEEFSELQEALIANDVVQVADALGDMIYVILGAAISYGCENCVSEDMEDYCPREIGAGLHHLRPSEIETRLETFARYFDKLKRCVDNWDEHKGWMIDSRIKSLVFWCISFSHACGIPIREVFDEIHRSNMDKLWDNSDVSHIKTGWTVHRVPGIEKSIVRSENGKIIKPPKWKGPNLSPILHPQFVATNGT